MSTTPRTISNVELRIQWQGDPGPFFDSQHDGFPGADVPTELVTLLSSMTGSSVAVDPQDFRASAASALSALFTSFVGVRGPGANRRWSLTNAYSETRTSDGTKWQPGMTQEGMAFKLGVAPLQPGMIMDPDAETEPYSLTHNIQNPPGALTFSYWICFAFEQEAL